MGRSKKNWVQEIPVFVESAGSTPEEFEANWFAVFEFLDCKLRERQKQARLQTGN